LRSKRGINPEGNRTRGAPGGTSTISRTSGVFSGAGAGDCGKRGGEQVILKVGGGAGRRDGGSNGPINLGHG